MVKYCRWLAILASMAAGIAGAQVTYQWTEITPPGGRVSSVGTHPIDGRIIILGGISGTAGPVMYSNDHGATWNAPETPLPVRPVSMFVHVGSPGVVYLDEAGSFLIPGPAGPGVFPQPERKGTLYRSVDFGRTWSLVHTSAAAEWIHPFASDPLDAHGMFGLAMRDTPHMFGINYGEILGINQSHDDGANWSLPLALPIPPGYGNIVAAITGPTPADPMRLFVQMPDRRFLVSRDRGATWAPFAPSLPSRPQDVVPSRLEALEPDPLRANVLYITQYYYDSAQRSNYWVTYRSDDGAASWREIYVSRNLAGRPGVVIDPARTRTLWLGPEPDSGTSFALHRSEDAGETWQAVPYPGGPYNVPGLFNFQGLSTSLAEPGVVYLQDSFRLFRGVPSPRPDPIVVEYHYDVDRYWLTSLDGEAVSQDNRQEPLNVWRTGSRWGAWRVDDAPTGAVGSCRFWSSPRSGLRTRVLVLQGFECDALKHSPDWILEAENEFFAVPPVAGACGNGLVPVRRFNNLQPDANHRWVTDDAIAAEMRGFRAWYDEGVRFCARPLGPNE